MHVCYIFYRISKHILLLLLKEHYYCHCYYCYFYYCDHDAIIKSLLIYYYYHSNLFLSIHLLLISSLCIIASGIVVRDILITGIANTLY